MGGSGGESVAVMTIRTDPANPEASFSPAQPPATASLEALRAAAAGCRACPLWKLGTQTVFGEGPATARLLIVGEQPGDSEDRAGRPFVGPAGKLLDRALEEAGIGREDVYITNAVKHFKWEPHGKRRLHKKPNAREIAACRPWLEAELAAVRPELLLCLGATASRVVFGPEFRVSVDRGEIRPSPFCPHTLATVHPSSLLRAPDDEARHREMARFVADLKTAQAFAAGR